MKLIERSSYLDRLKRMQGVGILHDELKKVTTSWL